MPVKQLRPAKLQTVDALPHSDAELVRGCLESREESWNALVQKYQNLVFSIPLRYGLRREEAADIFQSVFLNLLEQLPKLREAKALPKWLIQVTAHQCYQWKRQSGRLVSEGDAEGSLAELAVPAEMELNFREFQESRILREAVDHLPQNCRTLVHMLFFEEPSRPYQQVAESLGLATGSIGLLRQKCLENLRKRLAARGF
jgi:RNA polymerase sigma factor (sigma-70 family)